MEAKQYATKQPMDHLRYQRGNQKIPREKWKWKYADPKAMECSKRSSKREVYSDTSLPQETRQISNNLTLCWNILEREEQTKPKVSRRKEIITIRAEINEIGTKKIIEKINETKNWFSEKINKIYKTLARLIKKKIERVQINKIRNEKKLQSHHRNTKDRKKLLQATICQ